MDATEHHRCPGCKKAFADRERLADHIADVLDIEIGDALWMLEHQADWLAFCERWANGWRSNVEQLGLDGLGPEPRKQLLGWISDRIVARMAEARADIVDAVVDDLGISAELAAALIAAAETEKYR